jgi:CheY-like chemotaxis protein
MGNVILVIEDDPDQRRLMERTLATAGHRILPKLIILDVMMPKMNGYQAARALKQNPATAEIPILMVTAKQEPADEFWSSQVGAVGFLTKPVDIAALIKEVNKLTGPA